MLALEHVEKKLNIPETMFRDNADYLKGVLSHLRSDNICVKLKTPISAALFSPNKELEQESITMLLMPIRLNE